MIFIDRNSINKPRFFYSKEYEASYSQLLEFYKIPFKNRSQKRFQGYKISSEVTKPLEELFNSKCAYCETLVDTTGKTPHFIDHFRPSSNARGFNKESTSIDHYWWLMYEWNNLYLSCWECQNAKSSWFPVTTKRVSPLTPYEDIILKEINLIVDPCNDVIEKHLKYDFSSGNVLGLDERGKTTIEILKLNRRKLANDRLAALKEEFDNWERISKLFWNSKRIPKNKILRHWESILNHSSKVEFLGARKALLLDRLDNNPEIKLEIEKLLSPNEESIYRSIRTKQYPPVSSPPPPPGLDTPDIDGFETLETISNIDLGVSETNSHKEEINKIRQLLKNVYIERIELKNYKCFDNLKIDLSQKSNIDKEPWLVFLGENGVGKSSLVKAVALALMGQKYLDSLGLDAKKILKYGKWSGHVRVYGSKKEEYYEVSFNKDSRYLTSNINEPPCYLLGYGSTRLLPKGNLEPEHEVEYIKAKNLFDYSVALSDAREWLLNIPSRMFNQVALSLKDLLLLDADDVIKRRKQENSLYISYAGTGNRTDVEELSDGYKSIFAITVDIIKTLSKDNLSFETAEAIVLIDEIGTHLHPRWKMEVVSRLRKTFPKIQFIVTTHEPLCLRGLEKNEVQVLKRNDEGKIISIGNLPNPSDFRVDQLLTSEYFGLNSTLDFETESLFKEYYELLAKDKRTFEEQNRVSQLNQILPNKKHIGDDIRDELVYFVIDELLAKQVKKEGFKIIDQTIKKEALERVKSIWDFMSENEDL